MTHQIQITQDHTKAIQFLAHPGWIPFTEKFLKMIANTRKEQSENDNLKRKINKKSHH